MEENHNSTDDDGGFKAYLTRHMLIGVVLAVVAIIALKIVLGFFEPSDHGRRTQPASRAGPGRGERCPASGITRAARR